MRPLRRMMSTRRVGNSFAPMRRSGALAAAAVAPRSALLAALAPRRLPRRLCSAALQAHHSFYIDGEWVEPSTGDTLDVIDHGEGRA